MKIQDLLNQYYFHDSSLEQLSVDETAQTVSIDLYFCNWLQSYFTPDLPKNIQVRLLFQGVRSFKKENLDRSIDYTNLSKGELYTLLLLAKYVASEVRGDVLIAIDEPENSIHPKQYSAHAQTIAPIIMDDCNVLIASQSPFFVQYYEPENYYIGRPYSRDIADFARINNNCMSRFKEDARNCSETPGVFVFDLLSGSDDEIEQLVGYLEEPEEFYQGEKVWQI